MLNILVVLAIVLTIALGFITHINTGFFGIAFAYIIGSFVMGLKPAEVISMWPTNTFFVFFSVSMFFNLAGSNGTLEKLSQKLVYSCRKVPALIPYAIFLAAVMMSALGVSFMATMAFMAPIALALAEEIKADKFTCSLCAFAGTGAGANFVTGGNGIIYTGLLTDLGYTEITSITLGAFAVCMTFFLTFLTLYLLATKSFAAFRKNVTSLEKPEPLTTKQKQTLGLIFLLMFSVLGIPVLSTITGSTFLTALNSKINVGLVSVVLILVALFMKLGNHEKVLVNVPWNTLIMLCGVGMLVAVAVKAGTVEAVGNWVSTSLPPLLVPVFISLIASFMSFFSSAAGVVCPALFPMVPAMVETTGLAPVFLFSAIIAGAQATAISPFSTGGSLILASCQKEEDRKRLYKKFITQAVPGVACCAAIFSFLVGIIA